MLEAEVRQLREQFNDYYPEADTSRIHAFFAPGRINLIGEHTDYNGGYVFPAALTLGTYMLVHPRPDNVVHVASTNFEQRVQFSLDELTFREEDDWGNFPKGVLQQLQKAGVTLTGADVLYKGTIPNGAGLSSSASIGMVTAFAFADLGGADLDKVELARLCQRMENEFIGVNSGIMDQFAVGLGQQNHALFLDTHSMEYEPVPLKLDGYRLVITNTNKQRTLAGSKYNERRSECEQGLEDLQRVKPDLVNLGQLSLTEFNELSKHIKDEVVLRRVRHVVTEDDRVLKAIDALRADELETFGQLMNGSHESLRDDYEVTGVELDTLYDLQRHVDGCIGTRMTGAGFGGCTISIVAEDAVERFQQEVAGPYEEKTGLTPSFYVCEVGDGVKRAE